MIPHPDLASLDFVNGGEDREIWRDERRREDEEEGGD
jgi:hypothetical protein